MNLSELMDPAAAVMMIYLMIGALLVALMEWIQGVARRIKLTRRPRRRWYSVMNPQRRRGR